MPDERIITNKYDFAATLKEVRSNLTTPEASKALSEIMDHLQGIQDALDSYKEPWTGGRSCYAYRAVITLHPNRDVRWLQQFASDLKAMDDVVVFHDLSENTVTVIVRHPHSLKNAPSGTHEFARGYIVAKNIRAIHDKCDLEQVFWKKIEVSTDHRYRVLREFDTEVNI